MNNCLDEYVHTSPIVSQPCLLKESDLECVGYFRLMMIALIEDSWFNNFLCKLTWTSMNTKMKGHHYTEVIGTDIT